MWHCLSPSLAPSDHLQVALSPCLCLWLRLISAGSFPFKPDAAFSAPLCCVSIGCSRERGSVSVRGRLCFLGLSALIMEFLLGNPFSTPLGQRIERATCSSLSSEDWALNMEICDVINSSEEGPRDAVRAIRKRIVGNKNFKEVLLALTVLETCVKNCGYRFHILVTTRDFIEGVLVRSIVPRNNPPLVLHDRVLSIIQAWADAFRSSPDLTGVVSVYEDLRRKGLEFPMTELDGYSPVQAPKKVKRLKAELGVVRSNLTMMSDMMSQLDPVTVKQADMELLELYTVCKEMQDRIVKIVPRLSEEKLIEELLATNDEMNTAFTRYHRFERRITNGQNASHKSHSYSNLTDLELTAESLSSSGVASFTRNSSLSHSKSDSLSSHLAKLSTSESDDTLSQKPQQAPSDHGEVVVDGLARAQDSRLQNTGTDDSPASTRSSSPKLDWMIKRGMIPINQSNVMDDIEKWLELDDDYDDFEDSDGVTSAEFDRFLAERAKAAERLPSLRASSQDTNQSES
ncbi:target of Myb protein 1 isoform X6 [Anabas testudineus]|uniref:target of Myb protein 1 isoform X6 n=1 Tax=Anabas testudineus TaxID=64144 RepID=UPI000E45C0E7|nr:target of Myb protein 1 isoform X6 [Anabas testudineus]